MPGPPLAPNPQLPRLLREIHIGHKRSSSGLPTLTNSGEGGSSSPRRGIQGAAADDSHQSYVISPPSGPLEWLEGGANPYSTNRPPKSQQPMCRLAGVILFPLVSPA